VKPRANGGEGPKWADADALALYVHWPFCKSKCPYCDFNSHVRESVDHGRWRRALEKELDHFAERTPGRRLTSIFFGGGTPSLMEPETVAGVISRAGRHWRVDDTTEISFEANPTSSEASNFAAYASAGIGRLSLGVQSLDDQALRYLGREHDAGEARRAIELAQLHFPRVSFDLMYARPGQDPAAWRDELRAALCFSPSHLSLYQLTIEEGTRFHALRRRGLLREMGDDAAARLFEETRALLTAAGLPAYEVSNHTRPGDECRHNLIYWRSGDYIGIGPGAHGRLASGERRVATRQHRAPEAWLELVERGGHATRETSDLSAEDRLSEFVMMGLRLTEGIPRSAFQAVFGSEPEALLEPRRLEHLRNAELVILDDRRLAVTEKGFMFLNSVLVHLLA
jgi:oxygen-independent coproporphyrinogen-3 oxidase